MSSGRSSCDEAWLFGRFKNRIDAAVARDSYVISNNLKYPLNFQQDRVQLT